MQAPLLLLGSSAYTSAAYGALFFLLCYIVYLHWAYRRRFLDNSERIELEEKVKAERNQELEWHREKRFLMESQAREKQVRLAELIEASSPDKSHRLSHAATRMFFLGECIREERQYLGTDISKLSLIEKRLRSLGKECIKQAGKGARTEEWLTETENCRHIIQSNREDLRKAQNLLRNILGKVTDNEKQAGSNRINDKQMPEVIATFEELKKRLNELPEGLRTIARSTAEKARALFKESTYHIPNEDLHEVWKEQIKLDLFSSKHRPGGRSELLSAIEAVISALHACSVNENGQAHFDHKEQVKASKAESKVRKAEPVVEKEAEDKVIPQIEIHRIKSEKSESRVGNPLAFSDKENNNSKVVVTEATAEVNVAKQNRGRNFPAASSDTAWAAPQAVKTRQEKNDDTKLFRPFPGSSETTAKQPGKAPTSLVIFCSNNPELWNTTRYESDQERAIAIHEISGDPQWMGIKRLDTGEEVFAEISLDKIQETGEGKAAGFNGSNEEFYGARHLGFFSEECISKEVETLFTYGGWGFGHLTTNDDNTDLPDQVCGWAGKRIPDDTIFEFTLYDDRPEHAEDDQIIG